MRFVFFLAEGLANFYSTKLASATRTFNTFTAKTSTI